uniref:Small ribosomal subunit protein uS5m n=1 Tax=Panagrellus redivivus TaxID=6233 RepID=A0A7E4W5P4_PANRE
MAFSMLSTVTKRYNTVNFFMRRSGTELWKTITSVSKSGQKKGRRSTRQQIRPLDRFYRIGSSPLKIQFPGLNTHIDAGLNPVIVEEQTEDEIKEGDLAVRKQLEASGMATKRRRREKLFPLERGFSGHQVVGQKLGPPPPVGDVKLDDFQTYCLEVKRTSNMTGVFGRVHTMSALVITGNGRGLAGYAVGKAGIHRTNNAIIKAMNMAARKLFYVELLEDRTIYQDFYAECRNTKIFAQRRPAGFGLRCHPRLEKICEAIGIKDIYVKVEGNTKNYLALTHAFVTGLLNQETHEQLAERKGLHVVELKPERQYYPEVVASPILSTLKTE